MYLQMLRVSDGMAYKCALFDTCLTIADATLNSWKEAHAVFNSRPQKDSNPTHIDANTHRAFTRLVIQAIKVQEDREIVSWGTNIYPSEAIAYGVLKLWITQELQNNAS